MRRPVLYVSIFLLLSSSGFLVSAEPSSAVPSSRDALPMRVLPPIPTPSSASGGSAPSPNDAPFGPNVRVSDNNTPGNQNEITVAVASDGRIHMGWNDRQYVVQPDYRCGYSYSTNGGATWSANRLFDTLTFDAGGDPVVVTDSQNNVYFFCLLFDRGGGSGIYVYKSLDGGATFLPPVAVSDTPSDFADKEWAHAVGDVIFACYTNFLFAGGNQLRLTYSTDGGSTWAPTKILDTNGQGCAFASNVAGVIYAAWARGNRIWAFRSMNGGVNWSSPILVGPAPFPPLGAPDQRAGNFPSLAADRATNNVYVVWTTETLGDWDVRFSRSTNGALSWSPWIRVNDDQTNRQFMPSVAVDASGVVHVAWYDNRTGLMAIRYSASFDGGTTWFPSGRVTDAEWVTTYFIGDYIQLVADPQGFVDVGWTDHRSGENEAYFARSSAVGGPRLTRIDVSPPEAWTDADTPVAFTASGVDQYEQPYAISPTWESTGGAIAAGTYTPNLAGDWTVWANASGFSGSAIVHVSEGALARIDVAPADRTITADDLQLYVATGYDSHGNVRAVSPTWEVTNGAIDGTGLFRPSRVGTWTVFANESAVSGSTSVTVVPGVLAYIDVTPRDVTVTANSTVQYAAKGYDAKGNEVPIAPAWSAGAGSIDASGLYTPGPLGTHTITATEGAVSGATSVTVQPGPLARIDVTPPTANITADDTQQLTAHGYDVRGNPVSISPTWATTCGSVDGNGLYTPGPARACVVYANESGISGSALITVVPGRLARIDVIPANMTITADQSVDYTATGYDAKGNLVAIAPTWFTDMGTVGPSGHYTPSQVGTWQVTAMSGSIAGTANVTVTPGVLLRIVVIPANVTITADQSVDYTARGYDANGNVVSITPGWSAGQGSITASGHYTPSLSGMWPITATSGSVAGTTSVTVTVGIIFSIVVSPSPVTITADDEQQFQASGYDRGGNPVASGGFAWSVDNGTIQAGLLTPYRVGNWTVRATWLSEFAGSARVNVRPGKVARVDINPPSAHLREDGTESFSATAFDAKGNPVPNAQFSWAAQGGIGQVDSTGTFTATNGGRGQVVVTATDGVGTAEAAADVLVDASAVSVAISILPWIVLAAAIAFVVAVVLVRRRRRDEPPPAT